MSGWAPDPKSRNALDALSLIRGVLDGTAATPEQKLYDIRTVLRRRGAMPEYGALKGCIVWMREQVEQNFQHQRAHSGYLSKHEHFVPDELKRAEEAIHA